MRGHPSRLTRGRCACAAAEKGNAVRVDPHVLELLGVFFASMWGFGIGYATKWLTTRKRLARAEERIVERADKRMDAMLDELQALRAHVADLTLMMDDARPRVGTRVDK